MEFQRCTQRAVRLITNHTEVSKAQLFRKHTALIRITHWINAMSFFILLVSGIAILIAHPRFYWGETGYFDTKAWAELPISVNLHHTSWGRSLHFLGAWITVLNGFVYIISGIMRRHFFRILVPTKEELKSYMARKNVVSITEYGLFQKLTYIGVIFVLFPMMIASGLTMSPGITAACPQLLALFQGHQSARSIHFIVSVLLILFLIVHVIMVIRTGFLAQMRAMTIEHSSELQHPKYTGADGLRVEVENKA